MMRRAMLPVALLAAVAGGCENAGADRSLGLSATGVIVGSVVFDVNGSGIADEGDAPFVGARIRLLQPTSRDTVLRATSDADGVFAFGAVPVGTYAIVVDSASAGDTARVTGIDAGTVTVRPGDSVDVTGLIGFPQRAAIEVRTRPLGERLFLTGVALHARDIFSDTLLHVVDTSGAIRAVRLRPGSAVIGAGDSVRLRGRIAERLGQRVLDDVTVFDLGPTLIPTISTVTTANAATAAAGTLDAALVRVVNALVSDTATVGGHLTMTVNDGSGALSVRLDRAADVAFRPPLAPNFFGVGARFDLVGVLVPSGTGTFVLRPRSSLDLVRR